MPLQGIKTWGERWLQTYCPDGAKQLSTDHVDHLPRRGEMLVKENMIGDFAP